jgi:hypothetical protein
MDDVSSRSAESWGFLRLRTRAKRQKPLQIKHYPESHEHFLANETQ